MKPRSKTIEKGLNTLEKGFKAIEERLKTLGRLLKRPKSKVFVLSSGPHVIVDKPPYGACVNLDGEKPGLSDPGAGGRGACRGSGPRRRGRELFKDFV